MRQSLRTAPLFVLLSAIFAILAILPANAQGVPDQPPYFRAISSSGQVALTWGSVPGASSYRVTYTMNGGSSVTLVSSTTATTYTQTSMTNGAVYVYSLTAVNSAGASKAINVTATPGSTALSPPQYLTIAKEEGDLLLYWTVVSGATGYNIYRSTTSGGEGSVPVAFVGATDHYVDRNLTNGTVYYYTLTSVAPAGEGSQSSEVSGSPGSLILAAPAWIRAIAGSGTLALSWAAVPEATSFSIQRGVGSSTPTLYANVTGDTFTDTGLTNGTSYTYNVISVDANGQGHYASVSGTPGSSLAAPTGVSATASDSQTTVSWSSVTGATGYDIYRGTSSGAEGDNAVAFGISSTSYVDTGLVDGSTYYYVVAASNAGTEGSRSSEVNATPTTPVPNTPNNLKAAAGNTQVTLSWSASPTATSYTISDSLNGSAWTTFSSGYSSTTCTVTGLTNGTNYYFSVTPVNGGGSGTYATVTATPNSTPISAPVLQSALGVKNGVSLAWSAVAGASSYDVYQGTSTGGEGAVPVVTVGATSVNLSGLTNGTTYWFEVAAVAGSGEGSMSNELSCSPTSLVLPWPNDLALVPADQQITLTWTLVPGAATYNIQRSLDGVTYSNCVVGLGSNTFTDGGLTDGIRYYYSVRGVNNAGQGGYVQGSATPNAAPLLPPASLTISPNATTLVLAWPAVANADTYYIFRSLTSGGEGANPYYSITASAGSSFTDDDIASGTTYYYTVAGSNADGLGTPSNEASGTTGALLLPGPSSLVATPDYGQIDLTWTNQTAATSYVIFRMAPGSASAAYTSLPGGSTAFQDASVTPGLSYQYQIAGVASGVRGSKSSTATATPLAPVVPTGVAATAGDAQVTLTWTAVTNAASYNVYRGTAAAGEGSTPFATNVASGWIDTSPTNGTTYYYTVTDIQGGSESAQSTEVNATPMPPIPSAPTGLTAVPLNGQASLAWSPVSETTGYNVYSSTSSSGPFTKITSTPVSGTQTTYTDATFTGATTYYYVTGVNVAGEGAGSSVASTDAAMTIPTAPTSLTN